jgi:hypothetical protein
MTSIKLDVEVQAQKNWRGKVTGYTARTPVKHYRYLESGPHDTKAEAIARLQDDVLAALSHNEPHLVYYEGWVGMAYYDPHFGWGYTIRGPQDQRPEGQIGCTLTHETREEVVKRMRRHLAGLIDGLAGAQLLTSCPSLFDENDVLDYYGSAAWQAGCRYWRTSRKLGHRERHEAMREAGDNARRKLYDLVRNQHSAQAAYILVCESLEARAKAGLMITPRTKEDDLKLMANGQALQARIGDPVPAGEPMRRQGVSLVAGDPPSSPIGMIRRPIVD